MNAGYLHPEVHQHLAEIRDALQHPNRCHEEVTRRGCVEPCEKIAVALRYDPNEGKPYPVCSFHARADMVSLFVILAAASGVSV